MATRTRSKTAAPVQDPVEALTPADVRGTRKLNIPNPIRTAPTHAGQTASTGSSLLNRLTSLRQQMVGKAPDKAPKERPTLDMPPETQSVFSQFILAAELDDHFGSHSENLKNQLKAELLPLYIRQMWQKRTQPANPTLKTAKTINDPITHAPKVVPDCEGQFIVQEKMKVEANSPEQLVAMLQGVGLTEDNALKLVAENVDFTPNTTINFNQLMYGKYVNGKPVDSSPEEKVVAEKALRLLMGEPGAEPLSDVEKALLIDTTPNVTIQKGFLQRVCSYIEVDPNLSPEDAEQRGVDILTGILNIIKPTLASGRAKFGISDSLTERNDRLINGAQEILGISRDDAVRQAKKVLGLDTEKGERDYARRVLNTR